MLVWWVVGGVNALELPTSPAAARHIGIQFYQPIYPHNLSHTLSLTTFSHTHTQSLVTSGVSLSLIL